MGVAASIIGQSFPPKSKFDVKDIPDLSGKICIVTGANTGVGKETAKVLLSRNAKVYIASRNRTKAEEAIRDLQRETGREAVFLNLDLADLKFVKASAEEFMSKENQLHVLFNNGGIMTPPIDHVTAEGYDLQFMTNVVGHFYFTKLLLPTLIATAKTSPDGKARVVNTSSSGHLIGDLDFTTFKDGPARRKMSPQALYAQSKFGNIVFSNELARRYGGQGVVSTSLHPGNIRSDLQRNMGSIGNMLVRMLFYDTAHGAQTQLWAGTSPEGANMNGKYLIPWARVGEAKKETRDLETGRKLWDWLEGHVEDV